MVNILRNQLETSVDSDQTEWRDDEDFAPEGPVTDLYWWLIRSKGDSSTEDDISKWAREVRDEIFRDTGYALHALTFKDEDQLIKWINSDQDIYRWAISHQTYQRIIVRQQDLIG
jgi:hypothetical protein